MNLKELRRDLTLVKGKKQALEEELEHSWSEEQRLEKRVENAEKARAVIQLVARQTQQNLEFHFSGIVTSAFDAVFPEPYEFVTRFVERHNVTECDMFFVRDGHEMDPMDSSGGGTIDVAGYTLRTAYQILEKVRKTQILDEPFRYVSVDLQAKCSEMLKLMSEEFGMQIIMVSHLPEINVAADKIFDINRVSGVSYVSKIVGSEATDHRS